ncbi:hypothetical protein FH972_026301 [Carpinus fangiana]|uniref:ethanolamine-phosphate cytidylyltransferase n=1 Tax=Carpinus fangiana TaxID=176857 RepID=A0A5N6L4K1_9ROSI|nr:hypothetical protein FH972_026301 [Carpinus fangiana]
MKTPLLQNKWSPYLYDHEVPLRVHLRRLAHFASQYARGQALSALHNTKYLVTHPREAQLLLRSWLRRRVWTLMTALILVWMFALYRGEFTVFEDAVNSCDWGAWEQWPRGASPHHLVFVADPQLVDPHTYPGRPWPLSSLTVAHTDLYLRRSYSRIQRVLDPDTIMFLGDLFDGGREWSTRWSESPEKQYKGYKDSFWMREYERFCNIFFREWDAAHYDASNGHPGRRIIASLPGNHDLGFAQGVQLPVRDRFVALFGPSNRIDVIANHTFISLDSVSLSAKDEDSALGDTSAIWGPAQVFLDNAELLRNESIHRHRRLLQQQAGSEAKWTQHGMRQVHQHKVEEYNQPLSQAVTLAPAHYLPAAGFRNILLTHVPLHRPDGTPCGPLRERHPPSPGNPDVDEPNAISNSKGYQYQNTIHPGLSKMILDKLGGQVDHVFSGDDHDYCEVVHRAYPSSGAGIREITVKSISYAMGVRRPGFVMVSLWNPVDNDGNRILSGADDEQPTLQTHLCLLPDQLGVLIRYGFFIGLTLFCLLVRAFLVVFIPSRFGPNAQPPGPLLPTYSHLKRSSSSAEREKKAGGYGFVPGESKEAPQYNVSSSSSTSDKASDHLSARTTAAGRPQSASPGPSYGYGVGQPPASYALNGSHKKSDSYSVDMSHGKKNAGVQEKGKARRLLDEWAWSLWSVLWVVMVWYFWLARTPEPPATHFTSVAPPPLFCPSNPRTSIVSHLTGLEELARNLPFHPLPFTHKRMDAPVPAKGEWPTDPQDDQEIRDERIWIDGCFDFFHHGHAGVMLQAARLGRELYVGLHSDEDILEHKGPTVMNLKERVAAIDACRWATRCVPYAPYVTQLPWISHYGCRYVVHGDDITSDAGGEDCYRFVKTANRFKVVKRTPGISTTDLVGRMLLCTKNHFIHSLSDALAGHEGQGSAAERADAASAMRTRIREYASDKHGAAPCVEVWFCASSAPELQLPAAKASDLANETFSFTKAEAGWGRMPGQRLVYVDGGFDLFSSGHIEFLKSVVKLEEEAARERGWYAEAEQRRRLSAYGFDYGPAFVAVGMHDDEVINRHKGLNYPIMNLFERGLCVIQCKYVNGVIFGAPFAPTKPFLTALPYGTPDVVYHGPTAFMPVASTDPPAFGAGFADPYVDAKDLHIFQEVPRHDFQEVNAGHVVERIMRSRAQYEERQRLKAGKALGEAEARAKEIADGVDESRRSGAGVADVVLASRRSVNALGFHRNVARLDFWLCERCRFIMFSPHLAKTLVRNICQTKPFPIATSSSGPIITCPEPVEEERAPFYDPKYFYPVRLYETFNGKYQVAAKLGWGTSSTVWLARDLSQWRWQPPRYVTLKVCANNFLNKEDAEVEMRMTQLVTAAGSQHEGRNFVRTLLDSFHLRGPDGNHVCMVFDTLREPLSIFKRRYKRKAVPLSLLKVIAPMIIDGLDYLHSVCHLIHTDLKLDNVLLALGSHATLDAVAHDELREPSQQKKSADRAIYLSRNDFGFNEEDFGRPVITDFGLSVRGDERELFRHPIQPDNIKAPEVVLDAGWSYSADMWSLGIMIWELLEGTTPFDRPNRDTTPHSSENHLARIISLLGSPPLDFLEHGQQAAQYFDDRGNFKFPDLIDSGCELQNQPMSISGAEKEEFLNFIKKMLCWRPTDRSTAAELLSDPWLPDLK